MATAADGPPLSCYILEFSVLPGGARQAELHVGGTIDDLHRITGDHWGGEEVDGYLILSYLSLFQLWVVQEGRIVQGIDLHPYLRTGNARCDRTLRRFLLIADEERCEEFDVVMEAYGFDATHALPVLTRVIELQDRREAHPEDDAVREELEDLLYGDRLRDRPDSYDGLKVEELRLDWDVLAAAVPPLREPVLTYGPVGVRWADPAQRDTESHLHEWTDPSEPMTLHAGLTDLETGVERPLLPPGAAEG